MNNFFSDSNLKIYRESDDIKDYLKKSNSVLVNRVSFREFLYDDSDDNSYYNSYGNVSRSGRDLDAMVLNIASKVCNDDIDYNYGKSSIKNALSNLNNTDILFLMMDNYKDVTEQGMVAKRDKILGFIVAEKGECKIFPNKVSINLICVRNNIDKVKYNVKSSVLLAAYLCMIKQSKYDQVGILELAGGYTNTKGLCAYNKFGFVHDKTLEKYSCFNDDNNLPMSVDLEQEIFSIENIIKIVVTNKPLQPVIDLCDKYVPRTEMETKMQLRILKRRNSLFRLHHINNKFKKKNRKNLQYNSLKQIKKSQNTFNRSRRMSEFNKTRKRRS
jgi:hypothetical protein